MQERTLADFAVSRVGPVDAVTSERTAYIFVTHVVDWRVATAALVSVDLIDHAHVLCLRNREHAGEKALA